ncbi:hypothetical protein BLNAU_1421 [Blattamonas nauphoetae]|uniref:Uncharacterized protein n=1 Tax=Blattamonas nauphoetae TaxID=2049346 RepID=A0ABQ9YIF8_9EUKA|nr:hypothetical protein BLNAU_1421 [Blattamonas nauphoetae]
MLTLKVDDPTKSSVSLVIPTQPTPNVSFTHAMSILSIMFQILQWLGLHKSKQKPPTVHPASSPLLSFSPSTAKNHPQTPHSQSIRPINHNTSRTSNFRPQSPVEAVERTTLKESSKCTSTSPVQEAIKYFSVKELRKNRVHFETGDWVLCIDASCAIVEKRSHTENIQHPHSTAAGEGEEWASHNAKFRQCERSLQVMCVSTHLPPSGDRAGHAG